MSMAGKNRFAHRLTDDHSFESICLECFRTVGRANLEAGLTNAEATHTCLPEDVISLHERMGPKSTSDPGPRKKLA